MVKPEIFGSRKSILKDYLENIKKAYPDIEIINRIWFGTCLYKYNPDKKTRYIIFYECCDENEFNVKDINFLQEIFNPYIPILKVYIKGDLFNFFDIQKEKTITLESKYVPRFILSKIKCDKRKLQMAITETKNGVSDLSKFFREKCFGRLGISDIDLIVIFKNNNKVFFIEEKLYTKIINNKYTGDIGLGQLLSLKEIVNDVLSYKQKIYFFILFYDEKSSKWFKWDLMKNKEKKYAKYYSKQYKEHRFLFNDLEEIEINNLFNDIY